MTGGRSRRPPHDQMRGEDDLARRGPATLEPLYGQRDRLPGLLARILADGGEIHVGETRQHAVVISHDRKEIGNLQAQPEESVDEPDGAAVVGRYHRGGEAAAGGEPRGGADACVLGVVARDNPYLAGETMPAHGVPVTPEAV